MHTLCVAKSWIPTVFCALKVLSHDLTLCMCTACATTVVGRSLYHYPYVWDTNLPTTVSLPQSMKTGTGWKGWNSRKFPKFRAVVGSKISAYWTSLTIYMYRYTGIKHIIKWWLWGMLLGTHGCLWHLPPAPAHRWRALHGTACRAALRTRTSRPGSGHGGSGDGRKTEARQHGLHIGMKKGAGFFHGLLSVCSKNQMVFWLKIPKHGIGLIRGLDCS